MVASGPVPIAGPSTTDLLTPEPPPADPSLPPPVLALQPNPHPETAPARLEAQLRAGVGDLLQFDQQAAARALWNDAAWAHAINSCLLTGETFRAGSFNERAPLWRLYFDLVRCTSHPLVQRILPWLSDGYTLHFQPVTCQSAHPRFEQRLRRARAALTRAVGPERAARLLAGSRPEPVRLPNHPSAAEHAEFVRSELQAFVRLGALTPHNEATHGPAVVHPISVAVRADSGKKRLCIDANYTNIFEPYRPVAFELLKEVLPLLRAGDLASTSDLTKGYLHLRLHPSASRFLAVCFDNTTYVFTALPFGLQSAVWAFSSLMHTAYLPLRIHGWRLSFMIDDCITLWRRRQYACLGAFTFIRIMCALGCHFGLAKCRLGPHKQVRYQGMILDLGSRLVRIPSEKLQAFQALVDSTLSAPSLTPRALARLAGLLVSFHAAVPLGPLFTHRLFSALVGTHDWDSTLPLTPEVRALLSWLRSYVPSHNGKRLWARAASTILVTDASASGAGGIARFAAPAAAPTPLAAQLPPDVCPQSSGCREVAAMVLLVRALLARPVWRQRMQHGRLHLISDSQVAVRDVQEMKGAPPIFAQVCQLYELLAPHDVDLSIEWRPREDAALQCADYLSKCTDVGDWGLLPHAFAGALQALGCAPPAVDWFAAPWNAHAPVFYTRFLCAGAAGADAFDFAWNLPAGQLGLICPPHTIIPRVLAKIAAEQASCILILPAWWAAWSGQIALLPVHARVRLPGSCVAWGPRAPPPARRCAALHAGLWAYLIQLA